MKYKLKSHNGKVTFLLKTGKDYAKNEMSVSAAQHIIDTGTFKESDMYGYPICIDDKWFFEGDPVKTEVKKDRKEK